VPLDNFRENQLLTALPEYEYGRLAPYLELVIFSIGTVLHEPAQDLVYAYFPNSAMISLVSIMENGATTEIGLIGNEGFVGLPIILGGHSNIGRAIVQIPGTAFKIEGSILKEEFERNQALHKLVLLYIQARLTQVAQTAACNQSTYHTRASCSLATVRL
jgi:hypothetical protein